MVLNYACTDESAGAKVNIRTDKSGPSGIVKTTGGWEEFTDWNIGSVTLTKGVNTVSVEAESRPGLGVMNLKSVLLIPVKK